MAASNDLFELIQALTKSEKRYFRMSATRHSRNRVNKYVHLFDLIDRCEFYDEEAIREQFAARFGEKHFAEAKYYLYNAILKALHSYEADNKVEIRLTTMLHQARILSRKNLVRQCAKLQRKIYEEAVQHELWPIAMRALQMESNSLLFEGPDAKPRLEQLFQDMAKHGATWLETLRYWEKWVRILFLRRTIGNPRDAEQFKEYDDVMCAGTMQHQGFPSTSSAQYYYENARAFHQHIRGDFNGEMETYRSLLQLIATNDLDTYDIIPPLYSMCISCALADNVENFNHYHALLLQHSQARPGTLLYRIHIQALGMGAEFLAEQGEFDNALKQADELERCLAANGEVLETGIAACVHEAMCKIHFGLGNYQRCISHINTVLALRNDGLPMPMHLEARVYQIIVHFELGNFDLLESLLRSTHRFMTANGCHYDTERVMLAFIRRALRTEPGIDRKRLFSDFLHELERLQSNPFENRLGYLWLLSRWLEGRITGRPYAEVVHRKFRERYAQIAENDALVSTYHGQYQMAGA